MTSTTRGVVIVAGSDAAVMAGVWARETASDLPVTLVVRDSYPNFSICGIPFFVSGETPHWSMLAHRTVAELEESGLRLLLDHTAVAIDRSTRIVKIESAEDGSELGYDELVIARSGHGAPTFIGDLSDQR